MSNCVLNSSEAMKLITGKAHFKYANYAKTRTRQLISAGKLEEFIPKTIFVELEDGTKCAVNATLETLVTLDSVLNYIEKCKDVSSRYRPGRSLKKPIEVAYLDGEKHYFDSITDAVKQLDSSYHKVSQAIKERKKIQVKARAARTKDLPDDIYTESVLITYKSKTQ
jgi:hypothetical protein